jgi:hypothetical protein
VENIMHFHKKKNKCGGTIRVYAISRKSYRYLNSILKLFDELGMCSHLKKKSAIILKHVLK